MNIPLFSSAQDRALISTLLEKETGNIFALLSGFGFAESFLDPGNSSDSSSSKQSSNSVLTFGNTNFGLGLNLQWEIDVWGLSLIHI